MSVEFQSIVSQTNFSNLDWGIVLIYLLITLGIGFAVKRHIKGIDDFIAAGRRVGTGLGIATMTGTEMGLVTVMYSAQKGFLGGFAAFHIAVIAGLITFLVGATGFIVYKLRETKVLTIPEYYERRFGKKVRVLGGIMLTLGGILNMGLFLKVGSMFIVGITGLSGETWALPMIMTLLLVLVLIYTSLGGMVSVVITDYIQFVILAFGLVATTGFAIHQLGWVNIWETVQTQMGEKGFNPFSKGQFGIDYVIWMGVLGLVSCAIWPTAIARALAMDSPENVKRQYKWSSVSFLIRFLIPYFWGICAFVFIFTAGSELNNLFFPTDPNTVSVDNLYAMPIFLGKILPAGLIGILTAGMIAAFMSTHDSYLLCWSSVITQDIIAPMKKSPLSQESRIKWTRTFIILIGIYILYWGLIYEGSDDIWDYMAITGAIYFTGAIALLIGGLYWKKASPIGAMMALVGGLSAILGLSPIQSFLGISFPGEQIGLISVGLSIFLLIIGSLLFPDSSELSKENNK